MAAAMAARVPVIDDILAMMLDLPSAVVASRARSPGHGALSSDRPIDAILQAIANIPKILWNPRESSARPYLRSLRLYAEI